MTRLHIRRGISQQILLGFIAMAMMIGALGASSYHILSTTGQIVADSYDRPLMTVNYGRAANQNFTEMELALFRRQFVPPPAQVEIDHELRRLAARMEQNLSVARAQALSERERATIDDIAKQVASWQATWQDVSGLTDERVLRPLSAKITSAFDRLVQLTTADSAVERQHGLSTIDLFEYSTIAAIALTLLVAGVTTLLLTRRIVRPLSTAAEVANRIANGQFDTVIPRGFNDETGILLHSMSVMRDGIRSMMAREQTQRRSAQTRLADALESSREGMVLVDGAGSIVIANSQLCEFFPPIRPLCGEGVEFSVIARVIREQMLRPEETPHLAELPPQGGEFQLADNRWIRVSRSRTRDGSQFFFFSDFTDVKEREQRYREAQLDAEAASRAKSSFVANMSHELRTPLNAIIGFSEIMQREMFGKIENENYAAYVTDILQSGRHLLTIINGVLDLAKSQSGKLQIQFETVDIGDVLADCVAMMRDQCARAGLLLAFERPAEPMAVPGEPAKLRQVFLNLLSNAIKFTEPGGSVALMPRADGDAVTIEVRDTGIGMSPDDVIVALAPFGQVDSRLARRYEGTGLGLPLAKELVELHHGALMVESEPGRGTTIRVELPTATAEEIPVETLAA